MIALVAGQTPWWTSLEAWARIADIALGVSGFAAFYQLRLSRQSLQAAEADNKVRIRREAALHTAELCKRFADSTIPLFAVLEKEITQSGQPLPSWGLVDYSFSASSIAESAEANAWIERLTPSSAAAAIRMLNELEAVAMYLVSGVADERRAFPILSRMFTSAVERLAPVLISMRTHAVGSGQFPSTVELYQLWNERIRGEKLSAQKAEIDKAAKLIAAREIPPIGLSARPE